LSIDIRYCRHGRPVPAQPGPGSGRRQRAKSGHTRTAWPSGQIDPLLPSKLGPANGMEARESGLRLKAWRRTRAAIPQRRRGPLEAWHEARGRSRADHHRARPLPITLDELSQAAEARRAVRVALLELGLGASKIWPTASPWARAPTKTEPHGFSIERILLLVQSNCRLVGFLLRTLGFGGAVGANKYFAFHFRHPEKINQLVEAGRFRHGFEFGGHAGDVTGNVQRFPRHSPVRRVVGSSRRSRGSTPFGSPISAFRFHETHLRGHPIKLPNEARPIQIAGVESKFYAAKYFITTWFGRSA
jgi:hypothetical protein